MKWKIYEEWNSKEKERKKRKMIYEKGKMVIENKVRIEQRK